MNYDNKLKPFINHFPKIENFSKQIIEKKAHNIDRDTLFRVLKSQNANNCLSKKSETNINLLKLDNTFTVSTGHQLCLFTGPLYFIYKIVSAINLCDQLKQEYPTNNFVPIFWMASEDHDFKEINHIYLFGKKLEFDTLHNGPVGKLKLEGINHLLDEVRSVLGVHKNAEKLISIFKSAYLNHNNLADSTRYIINEIFGQYGLVIIDGNNKDLKSKFIPQMKKDIIQRGFVDTIKNQTNILAKNYKAQAYIRDINFFKLGEAKRELIEGDIFANEIEKNPELFSPNVLLRPLYQEVVLPNIAYIGGSSEIAYWMQLKTAFNQEKIPFPILVIRNSALLVYKKQYLAFKNLGFKLSDLFLLEDELNKKYVISNSNKLISLSKERAQFNLLYNELEKKIYDFSLKESVNANLKKQLNFLDNLEEKLLRHAKKDSELAINRIKRIKNQLFPFNSLQERIDSFIPYYLNDGDNFIEKLRNNFDPLKPNFIILTL